MGANEKDRGVRPGLERTHRPTDRAARRCAQQDRAHLTCTVAITQGTSGAPARARLPAQERSGGEHVLTREPSASGPRLAGVTSDVGAGASEPVVARSSWASTTTRAASGDAGKPFSLVSSAISK